MKAEFTDDECRMILAWIGSAEDKIGELMGLGDFVDIREKCEAQLDEDKDYREWSEMKAEGIEVETMQEYVDEVRGFNDYDEPEPYDPYDDPFD